MTIDLTDAEARKVREVLIALPVSGPLDAVREHVAVCDAILAKLEPKPAADPPEEQ